MRKSGMKKLMNFFSKFFKKDRRKFKRFAAREVTPVFIGKGVPTDAQLVDISMGGISVVYNEGTQKFKDIFAVDLQASDGFQLGKVLLEKLGDKKVRGSDRNYGRRIRGQFLNLSQAKANKLQHFLDMYQQKIAENE